jgi:hypothetical protein
MLCHIQAQLLWTWVHPTSGQGQEGSRPLMDAPLKGSLPESQRWPLTKDTLSRPLVLQIWFQLPPRLQVEMLQFSLPLGLHCLIEAQPLVIIILQYGARSHSLSIREHWVVLPVFRLTHGLRSLAAFRDHGTQWWSTLALQGLLSLLDLQGRCCVCLHEPNGAEERRRNAPNCSSQIAAHSS